MGTRLNTTIGILAFGALFSSAGAKSFIHQEEFQARVDFAMLDTPVARVTGERLADSHPFLAGSALATLQKDAMVVDADSGQLVWTDETGKAKSQVPIGKGSSQLVIDPRSRRVFVADREHDRVAVVTYGQGLTLASEIQTHAEPYGVALTPDRSTLLVTTVADRRLSAYDTKSGEERWSIEVGPEPRGVAISPNGREALIGFLTTAAVARVAIDEKPKAPRFVSLDRSMPQNQQDPFQLGQMALANPGLPQARAGSNPLVTTDAGRRFSRSAFATRYISSSMAVVPHQESTPLMSTTGGENTGTYGGGGGFESPIAHRLAFLSTEDGKFETVAKAQISLHQPRALALDTQRDILYVAGYGSDELMAIADVSRPSVHMKWKGRLSNTAEPCGPVGLGVADDGKVMAFCSLSRRVAILDVGSKSVTQMTAGPTLTKSRLSAAAQRGQAMFRIGNDTRMSTSGAMACESCHPEGRTDGLMWRIQGASLNTPMLAGKVMGTHPFKWDGGDANIQDSLRNTVTRLGGAGIDEGQAADIAAFLGELKAPRAPTVASPQAVARGAKLFRSKEVGCATCHSGKLRTNRKTYELANDLAKVDTPALVGLAASAPYYHDGSATTLRSLLLENGTIHGMGKLDQLNDDDVDALVAYLETL